MSSTRPRRSRNGSVVPSSCLTKSRAEAQVGRLLECSNLTLHASVDCSHRRGSCTAGFGLTPDKFDFAPGRHAAGPAPLIILRAARSSIAGAKGIKGPGQASPAGAERVAGRGRAYPVRPASPHGLGRGGRRAGRSGFGRIPPVTPARGRQRKRRPKELAPHVNS